MSPERNQKVTPKVHDTDEDEEEEEYENRI
jgi:hypothetical protein